MKPTKFVFLVAATIFFFGQLALAQIPQTISYQGVLTDAQGNAVSDGSYSLTFNLYESATGGSSIWGENQDIEVVNGVFNVILGSVKPLSNSFDRPYWLGIAIDSDPELEPRIELTASAYSLNARSVADSSVTGEKIADGQVVRVLQLSPINGFTASLTDTVKLRAGSNISFVVDGLTGAVLISAAGGNGSSGGWSLSGNAGTDASNNFLGTTDDQALELRVNNRRVLRLEPGIGESPNIIGGNRNEVSNGVVGATIGGGGSSFGRNLVSDDYGTVSGGQNNEAGDDEGNTLDRAFATVGGGIGNRASGDKSTVAGGAGNFVSSGLSTVGGGESNTASGAHATVGGGEENIANNTSATIGGGSVNQVHGFGGTVAGGGNNIAGTVDSHRFATVGGGMQNQAIALGATVSGGESNRASGAHATVGGGENNSAEQSYDTVSGGRDNVARGDDENGSVTVGGGSFNQALSDEATVAGGASNTASGRQSVIGGGRKNVASGQFATIAGGNQNHATRSAATIGGGENNVVSGQGATVPGGDRNHARGNYSFAAGSKARAIHDGSFVWNDRSAITLNDSLVSTANNQFLIRAAGGVGIGTNSPNREVTVFDNDNDGDAAINIKASNSSDRELLLAVNQSTGGIISVETNNPLSIRTNAIERMRVTSSGNVGIGIANPTERLHVNGNALADAHITPSSCRWKTNIQTIENSLEKVQRLRGVTYDWKTSGKHDIGLIAEEVGEVIPEIVAYEENGVDAKSVDYARLVAVLIEAVKEQQETIDELKRENGTLAQTRSALNKLNAKVDRLASQLSQTALLNLN